MQPLPLLLLSEASKKTAQHEWDEDLTRPRGTGVSPFPINCKPDPETGELVRWSVNDGYLEPLRSAASVEIRSSSYVRPTASEPPN